MFGIISEYITDNHFGGVPMASINELSNGVKVVLEEIPYVRSISFGIWVNNGSVNEPKEINGVSHYIEHMMFKGTKKRSARQIAEEMDELGGQINAYTTKEYTCYHTRTLDKHFDIALDVLSDMFLNSRFDEEDIKKERNVIIEEINMYDDAPEELVHDEMQVQVWKDNAIGMPILGTEETISRIDSRVIKDYFSEHYRNDNTVISVVGYFKEKEMLEKLEKAFGGWKTEKRNDDVEKNVKYIRSIKAVQKDTEQVHVCLAFPSVERDNPKKYVYAVFNAVFGGGMSSILFQKVREDHGLTYSIYSYLSSYNNCGLFMVYAAMNPNQTQKGLQLIYEECEELKKNGISSEIIEKAKTQVLSNYIISGESTVNRMTSNGGSMLIRNRIVSQEEIIEGVEKITADDIRKIIECIFDYSKMSLTAAGNTSGINFEELVNNIFM